MADKPNPSSFTGGSSVNFEAAAIYLAAIIMLGLLVLVTEPRLIWGYILGCINSMMFAYALTPD